VQERTRRRLTLAGFVLGIAIIAFVVWLRKTETDRLIARITSGTPEQRLAATRKLVDKQKLADAFDEKDRSRWAQDNCVTALAAMGDMAAMEQMLLAKHLFDQPVEARCNALLELWNLRAIGPLVDALQEKDAAVHGSVIDPLKAIGPAVIPALLELTDAYDDYVRNGVRDVFAGDKVAPAVVGDLIALLKKKKPERTKTNAELLKSKATAIAALELMKIPAIDPLIEVLSYEDPEVRGQACVSLGVIADQTVDAPLALEQARRVVAPLMARLDDGDWGVRARAATALGKTLRTEPVSKLMVLVTTDSTAKVRGAAASALGLIAFKQPWPAPPAGAPPPPPWPRAGEVARALALALNDERLRKGAAQELGGALVRVGQPAIGPLSTALRNPAADVREIAATATATIGGPAAVAPLAERARASTEPSAQVRRIAVMSLRNMAQAAQAALETPTAETPDTTAQALQKALIGAVPALAEALADQDWHVYMAAQEALGYVGGPAVDTLIASLGQGDPRVSYTAERALAVIGSPAVPRLVASLTRANPELLNWSAIALGDIGEPAVRPTIRVLQDPSAPSAARRAAAHALGLTGLAVEGQETEALKALLAASHDPDPLLRREVVLALAELRGQRALEAVVSALSDADQNVREQAMLALARWPGADEDKALQQALDSPDADTARRAAIAIATHLTVGGLIPTTVSPELRGHLAKVLAGAFQDPKEKLEVIDRCVVGYGAVGADDRSPDLAKQLDTPPGQKPDEERIKAALRALAAIGARVSQETPARQRRTYPPASQAAEEVAKRLRERYEAPLAYWYALALAEMRESAVRPLDGLLAKEKGNLRLLAAIALARMGKASSDTLLDERGTFEANRQKMIVPVGGLWADRERLLAKQSALDRLGQRLSAKDLRRLESLNDDPDLIRTDARLAELAEPMGWLSAALWETGDTLARDFVEGLPEDQQPSPGTREAIEAGKRELARLRGSEW